MPKKGYVKKRAKRVALRKAVLDGFGHGADGTVARLGSKGLPGEQAMARDLAAGYRVGR